MQYFLIVITLAIAVFGLIKEERPSRKLVGMLIFFLVLSAIIQAKINWNEKIEKKNSENRQISLLQNNDSLLIQNDSLFLLNQDLLNRIENYQDELEKVSVNSKLIKEYSYYATLDPYGRDITIGTGIEYDTEISKIMKPVLSMDYDNIVPRCDDHSRNLILSVIKKYPEFPFSYFYMAKCLNSYGNDDWIKYAEGGVKHFEKTTEISGHNDTHDQALLILRKMLTNK